jgi:hypothetical protein
MTDGSHDNENDTYQDRTSHVCPLPLYSNTTRYYVHNLLTLGRYCLFTAPQYLKVARQRSSSSNYTAANLWLCRYFRLLSPTSNSCFGPGRSPDGILICDHLSPAHDRRHAWWGRFCGITAAYGGTRYLTRATIGVNGRALVMQI